MYNIIGIKNNNKNNETSKNANLIELLDRHIIAGTMIIGRHNAVGLIIVETPRMHDETNKYFIDVFCINNTKK